jgi:hypothetical protein
MPLKHKQLIMKIRQALSLRTDLRNLMKSMAMKKTVGLMMTFKNLNQENVNSNFTITCN